MLDKKDKNLLAVVIILAAINYVLYQKKMNELQDLIKNK
jgi:hypothetical protein